MSIVPIRRRLRGRLVTPVTLRNDVITRCTSPTYLPIHPSYLSRPSFLSLSRPRLADSPTQDPRGSREDKVDGNRVNVELEIRSRTGDNVVVMSREQQRALGPEFRRVSLAHGDSIKRESRSTRRVHCRSECVTSTRINDLKRHVRLRYLSF